MVTFFVWTLLIWDYYHGGVPKHHILANKDLPAISNWWGGLLLPLITWFLLHRIQIRIIRQNEKNIENSKYWNHILYRFIGSLLFGTLLSVFFTSSYSNISGYLVLGLFPLATIIPVYRAECLLGFIIGMTFTFGTILPTGIGSIFGLVGALVYLILRPGMLYVLSKFTPTKSVIK